MGNGRCIGVWSGWADLRRSLTGAEFGAVERSGAISRAVRPTLESAETGALVSAASGRGAVASSLPSTVIRIALGPAVTSVAFHVRSASLNSLPASPITVREIAGINQKRPSPIGRGNLMPNRFSTRELSGDRRALKATRLYDQSPLVRTNAAETF